MSNLRQTQRSRCKGRLFYFKNYKGKKIPLTPPILTSITSLSQILRRKQTILMLSSHLNVLQSLMIVLYPIQQIMLPMFVYYPFNSKIRIFLRLYIALTTIKLMVMMIYLYINDLPDSLKPTVKNKNLLKNKS